MFTSKNFGFSSNPTVSDKDEMAVLVAFVDVLEGSAIVQCEVYLALSEDPVSFENLQDGVNYFKSLVADFSLEGVQASDYRDLLVETSKLLQNAKAQK